MSDVSANTRNHDQVVTEQFGSTAAAYLTSTAHAQGADLQDIAAYAQQFPHAVVLDVGCGALRYCFTVDRVVARYLARAQVQSSGLARVADAGWFQSRWR